MDFLPPLILKYSPLTIPKDMNPVPTPLPQAIWALVKSLCPPQQQMQLWPSIDRFVLESIEGAWQDEARQNNKQAAQHRGRAMTKKTSKHEKQSPDRQL